MGKAIYVDNLSQAGRIINKFGNARRLAKAISMATGKKCDPSRIYRWSHPRTVGGTGGLIPGSAIESVKAAARLEGIIISDTEWSPTPYLPKTVEDLQPDAETACPH